MIKKIAPDKWKHLFVGITLGVFFELAAEKFLPKHLYWGSAAAFIIISCISYGWELLSKFTGRGHYEVMDAVYSMVGGLIGMLVVVLCW